MRIKILAVSFLLGIASVLFGQDSAKADREQDHNELRALAKTATDAINTRDYDKLAECFTEDFTFIAIDQNVIKGKKEVQAYYEAVLKNKEYGIKSMKVTPTADILTKFLGPDIGYCYGTADNMYEMESGKIIHMKSRWSANLRKENGKWKIVMVHAGVNFLDNPLLNAVTASVKGTMISMTVIVFVLIAIIIYLLKKANKAFKTKPTEVKTAEAELTEED